MGIDKEGKCIKFNVGPLRTKELTCRLCAKANYSMFENRPCKWMEDIYPRVYLTSNCPICTTWFVRCNRIDGATITNRNCSAQKCKMFEARENNGPA